MPVDRTHHHPVLLLRLRQLGRKQLGRKQLGLRQWLLGRLQRRLQLRL